MKNWTVGATIGALVGIAAALLMDKGYSLLIVAIVGAIIGAIIGAIAKKK